MVKDVIYLNDFSIFMDEDGTAYIIKGIGSHYTEALQIESADTSAVFRLDSSKIYLKLLDSVKRF